MAEISRLVFLRHLRADASSFVLAYRGARLARSGRGLAFWFTPWNTSLAELPVDDRELSLSVHGRSADFQDVVVQGVLTYRIVRPELLAERVDFSIDTRKGTWLRQPLEKLGSLLGQLALQHALAHVQARPLREVLARGHEEIRRAIEEALRPSPMLAEMGLQVVSVRVPSIRPVAEIERALEAPARERIQEESDEAAFRRRALAVEKERAIQENELQSQIELARREEQLIEQRGQNARRDATEKAEAARIETEAEAQAARVRAAAQAEGIGAVDGARVVVERDRLAIYRDLSPAVLAALAARELAGKLRTIEHLNVTPDLLGTMLTGLVGRGLPPAGGKP